MRVITRRSLLEFAEKHPEANEPLDRWYRIVKSLMVGEDENHPLARIEEYENKYYPEPKGDAIGCLKYLMETRLLKH
jgi:hypothetical protein